MLAAVPVKAAPHSMPGVSRMARDPASRTTLSRYVLAWMRMAKSDIGALTVKILTIEHESYRIVDAASRWSAVERNVD